MSTADPPVLAPALLHYPNVTVDTPLHDLSDEFTADPSNILVPVLLNYKILTGDPLLHVLSDEHS
jgi:hypothetical protein